MTLIKWKNEPALTRDAFPYMPTLFNDFFDGVFNNELLNKEVMRYVPSVNIVERVEDFGIELAAPGYTKEDFKVEADNGMLTISSEKREEKKDENDRYTRKEFSYTSFKRSFSLPEHVDAETISASYKDGLLSLTIPKREEARKKAVRERN